jgi:hypothetical protein
VGAVFAGCWEIVKRMGSGRDEGVLVTYWSLGWDGGVYDYGKRVYRCV